MKHIFLLLFLISFNLFSQDFSNKTLVYPFYPRYAKGETYQNLPQDKLCQVGYTKTVRNVSASTRKKVFKIYGITKDHYNEYELDHFLSLTLGGTNSINNLFPQPYEVYLNINGENIRMGAREKDVVENNLHKRVCRGEITLKEAQEIVITNWVGYYLKLKHKI